MLPPCLLLKCLFRLAAGVHPPFGTDSDKDGAVQNYV